jgi:hypothetical protein
MKTFILKGSILNKIFIPNKHKLPLVWVEANNTPKEIEPLKKQKVIILEKHGPIRSSPTHYRFGIIQRNFIKGLYFFDLYQELA